jgi:hypothetical protein
MNKFIAIIATVPTSGAFAWLVVRFIEWRRRLLRSVLDDVEQTA